MAKPPVWWRGQWGCQWNFEGYLKEYNAALSMNGWPYFSAYQKYLREIETKDTHRGYFSIDKKGRLINSKVKRGSEFSDDISAYDLILKNRTVIILWGIARFIFSHSALPRRLGQSKCVSNMHFETLKSTTRKGRKWDAVCGFALMKLERDKTLRRVENRMFMGWMYLPW